MKTAVVYFSRSGTTEKAARLLAHKLEADLLPIRSRRYPRGLRGYLRALVGAFRKDPEPIETGAWKLQGYDLVFVGTPIWGSHLAAPVRSFLQQRGDELPRVAFFTTCGGSGISTVFRRMTELTRQKPLATLGLTVKHFANPAAVDREIAAFADRAQQSYLLQPRAA